MWTQPCIHHQTFYRVIIHYQTWRLLRECDHLGDESVEQRTSLSQGRHPRSCHHLAPGEVHTHKLRTASTQRTEAVICHVVTRGDVHPDREFHDVIMTWCHYNDDVTWSAWPRVWPGSERCGQSASRTRPGPESRCWGSSGQRSAARGHQHSEEREGVIISKEECYEDTQEKDLYYSNQQQIENSWHQSVNLEKLIEKVLNQRMHFRDLEATVRCPVHHLSALYDPYLIYIFIHLFFVSFVSFPCFHKKDICPKSDHKMFGCLR